MQNGNKQKLLTETELAEYLNVSKKLLQKMRQEGNGPKYVKIGRLVRYASSDIGAFIELSTYEFTTQENAQ